MSLLISKVNLGNVMMDGQRTPLPLTQTSNSIASGESFRDPSPDAAESQKSPSHSSFLFTQLNIFRTELEGGVSPDEYHSSAL